MSALRGDLHIHTCLSPCADDSLTPAIAAGMAKLAGADVMAVTDHNSARNLPAAQAACRAYGLRLLPGSEVNTAEEIHLLCYFPGVEAAMQFGALLYQALPALPYDEKIWGRQLDVYKRQKSWRSFAPAAAGQICARAGRRCV